jgi:hypothetical protein
MKYRIYIDEVGNPDLGSSDNPNHRFLSLTGVIIGLDHVRVTVHPQMEALKRGYFNSHPDEPAILHRKELVNALPPFASLKVTATRMRFDAELLQLLASWEYIVISVCLDKKKHRETYTAWRYDPYHYCLAILLERFVLFLQRINGRGDAIAESRGGREDRRLKDSFNRLCDRGTDYIAGACFQERLTSTQLKVKPKAHNIAGLQLADLLAHPSRNEILQDQGLLERPLAPFARSVIEILQTKYDREGSRVFGKKFI